MRFPTAVRIPTAVRLTRPRLPVIFVRPATDEPTPWATGLTVTAIVAAVSLGTDVLLTLALKSSYGWLWLPANVLLCGGLSPSVWLLRNMPTWRWVSYGIVLGFVCAWLVLVAISLSPGLSPPVSPVTTAGS